MNPYKKKSTSGRKLTDKQKNLITMLIDNHKLHKTQRIAQGAVYLNAGYKNNNPAQAVASEIRKDHIKATILSRCPDFYGGRASEDAPDSPQEQAEEHMRMFASESSQGANNYALYLLKKKEAGIIEQAVDRVLLSPFLSEDELDAFDEAIPQDVVVATLADRPDEDANAETPAIIDEGVNDE